MQRTWLSQSSLVVCTLAFATAPLLAQQDAQDSSASPAQTQSQSQRQQEGDKQRKSANQQTPEQNEAIEHFLAGYYSGYVDGWSDGAQDLVIRVLDEQRRRVRGQVAAGHDPAPGCRKVAPPPARKCAIACADSTGCAGSRAGNRSRPSKNSPSQSAAKSSELRLFRSRIPRSNTASLVFAVRMGVF